jgi:hypothetical protein
MKLVAIAIVVCLSLCATLAVAADYNVSDDFVSNNLVYNINGSTNPTLTLVRGSTYTFAVSALGHPFWIKTVQSTTQANAYQTGVTNNGTSNSTLTFVVPVNAPSTLFYNCEFHSTMTGQINVVNPTSVSAQSWGRIKFLYR